MNTDIDIIAYAKEQGFIYDPQPYDPHGWCFHRPDSHILFHWNELDRELREVMERDG